MQKQCCEDRLSLDLMDSMNSGGPFQSCCDHRIIEWFELVGILKII